MVEDVVRGAHISDASCHAGCDVVGMGVERAVLDHQVTKRTKIVQDGGAVLGTAHGKGAQGHMVTTVLEFRVRATAADGSMLLDRFYWEIPDASLNKGRLAWREDGEEVSVDICLTNQLAAAIAARAADRGLREEYETALAYATAGDLAETNALARARRGRPRGGWPADERQALRDFHRLRVVQWTVALVILAIIAVTISVVVVASLDDPAPTTPVVGQCPPGVEHRPSLDPKSDDAAALRSGGYSVGDDGAGGSCIAGGRLR
ncbi:MAG: hypothetical protein RJA49_1912 [Actinomycetota bacterium]